LKIRDLGKALKMRAFFLFMLHAPHDDLMTIFHLKKRGTCSRFGLLSIPARFQIIAH